MRNFILLAFAATMIAGTVDAAQCHGPYGRVILCPPNEVILCVKGKKHCGHTCISIHDVCRIRPRR
jgi:hypothetical protein